MEITVAKTEENYTQTQFLGGLRKFINVIKKRSDFIMPDRSTGLTLFHHRLPSGVCKGYAYVAARFDVLGHEQSQKFFTVWAEINRLNELTLEQISEKFATWPMVAILEYLHYPQEIIRNQMSKAYAKELERPELTLSFIKPIYWNLSSFLRNVFSDELFTPKKSLIFSDATHAMSITKTINENSNLVQHINNKGDDTHHCKDFCDHFLYKLNDANNGQVIGTLMTICETMVKWFNLHHYDASHIGLRVDMIDYEVDPQFNNIIDQLQQAAPHLIDDYHAHSRVGLLNELKHQGKLKPGKIERKLLSEIYEYCKRFPTQESMLQLSHEFRDQPTLSGHSWLHITMTSGEPYLMQLLLDAGVDPNAGVDPTKKATEESIEKSDQAKEHHKSRTGITGKESEHVDELENIDDEVEQEDFDRYLSFPIHYAVVTRDLKQLTMLVEAGANVNQCTERGETPLRLARQRQFDEIANYLIENGAEEYVENNFPRPRALVSILRRSNSLRFTEVIGDLAIKDLHLDLGKFADEFRSYGVQPFEGVRSMAFLGRTLHVNFSAFADNTSMIAKVQPDTTALKLKTDGFLTDNDEDQPPSPPNSNNL